VNAVVAFGSFALGAAVIFFAGRRLSFYGDRIAVMSGWGGAWVGLVLMAAVTSLPELMVGISSSAVVGSADLAVGDVLGSCAVNLFILAAMDAFVPQRRPILGVASASHVLAAALGIILLVLVGLGLFLPETVPFTPWIGLSSLVFIGVYLSSMRLIYLHARHRRTLEEPTGPVLGEAVAGGRTSTDALTTRDVVRRYVLFAGVIVVTATALPWSAERIAEITALEESFVGTLFLAISTSLPEVAVSLAAVRMGAVDLAVGNLLGSNLFNILVLALDDVAYTRGFLLEDASSVHVVSVLSTIAMSAIVIIGLTYRIRGKRFLLAWDAALVLGVYVVNVALLLTL
jgi:cation:H+ antiporter